MVRTVKMLLNKNKCVELALLAYRNAPLQYGKSPADLLMGRTLMSYRTLRSRIPHLEQALKRCKYIMETLVDKEATYRNRMKRNFDNYHKAIEGTVL